MFQRMILLGRLGADPETRTSKGGTTIVSMRVATNRAAKVNEEWVDRTEWHSVTCFGQLGERCASKLRKGSLVLVEGRIETTSSGEGEAKRWYTKVIADSVQFVDGFGESKGEQSFERHPKERGAKPKDGRADYNTGTAPGPFADDDIPF